MSNYNRNSVQLLLILYLAAFLLGRVDVGRISAIEIGDLYQLTYNDLGGKTEHP